MPVFEILSLLVLAALAWLWFDGAQARTVAVDAAREACEDYDAQFLDESVAVARWSLERDDDGRLALRRVYAFDYSDNGNNRRRGQVTMLGQAVERVDIGLRLAIANATIE